MDYLQVQFIDINLSQSEAVRLRGYFANKYSENNLYHNHQEGRQIYRYPMIQYKVIDRNPVIVGLGDGAKEFLQNVLFEENVVIGEKVYPITQSNIKRHNYKPDFNKNMTSYVFRTPWLALNQKNYKVYKGLSEEEQKTFLEKILIGNILSFCKGINYHAASRIEVELKVEDLKVKFKGNKMLGFKGSFKTNFNLPDYIGLGKSVSRGFGAIQEVE